jgi:hypothetical protein
MKKKLGRYNDIGVSVKIRSEEFFMNKHGQRKRFNPMRRYPKLASYEEYLETVMWSNKLSERSYSSSSSFFISSISSSSSSDSSSSASYPEKVLVSRPPDKRSYSCPSVRSLFLSSSSSSASYSSSSSPLFHEARVRQMQNVD